MERKEYGVKYCPIHYQELMATPFKITAVTREDLVVAGIDNAIAESMTDKQMTWLAGKMADAYIPEMFWESIKQIVPLIKTNK